MKPCKFCWKSSFLITAFLCGCATTNLPPLALSKVKANDDKIFNYYCANNKQVRKLSVAIEYVTPQLPKMAVDIAAKEHAHYSKEKRRLLKKTLFSLSGGEEHPNGRGADFLLVKQSPLKYNELVEEIKEDVSESMGVRGLIMRPTDSNKLILFHISEQRHSSEWYQRNPTHVSELKILIDNFTFLEPLKYQEDAYTAGDDNEEEDVISDSSKPIAVDEGGQQSVSEAIEHKDEIWIRYISHFTKIKEAKSKNPRVINVDLELDLNGFCRYGRKVSDLQSQ